MIWLVAVLSSCGGGSQPNPALVFSPQQIELNTRAGSPSRVTVQAQVRNPSNFGNASTVYAVVVDPDQVLQGTPTLTQNDSENYTAELVFSPTLQAGVHQGQFLVKLCRDAQCASQFPGSPSRLPYKLTVLEPPALQVSDYSLGLSSTPSASRLSGVVRVTSRMAWSARTDVNWLSVTPSGPAGSTTDLTITATPDALPSEQISYATVTVATQPDGGSPIVVRVALWKSANDAVATTVVPLDPYYRLVADPLRPYVYVHTTGSVIEVFHTHTGQKVDSISLPGAILGPLAVTPDGTHLYALDIAHATIVQLDLDQRQLVRSWLRWEQTDSLLAIRPDNTEVLLLDNGAAYSETGQLLSTTAPYARNVAASPSGTTLVTQDRLTGAGSPATVNTYRVSYLAGRSNPLSINLMASATGLDGAMNGEDVAVDPTGSRVYIASGSPHRCLITDTQLTQLGAMPIDSFSPNNVEVMRDGRILCGIVGWHSGYDFWVHRADGTRLQSYKVARSNYNALRPRQLVSSADATVVIALTDDPRLVFVPVGR